MIIMNCQTTRLAAVFIAAFITGLSHGLSEHKECKKEFEVNLENFGKPPDSAKNHSIEELADKLNRIKVRVCENEFLENLLKPLAFLDFSGVNGQKLIDKDKNLHESSHRVQVTSKYILEQLTKTSDYKGSTVKFMKVKNLRFIQSNSRTDVHVSEEWNEIPNNRQDNDDIYVELRLKTRGRDTLRNLQLQALNEAQATHKTVPANFVDIEMIIENGDNNGETLIKRVYIHRFIIGELETIDYKEMKYFTMRNEDHPYWPVPVSIETGWILIQKRSTPGNDFDRDWVSYKDGFGHWQSDFWLGLEKIHKITKNGGYGIRFEFWTHTGLQRSAEYKEFRINEERKWYSIYGLNGSNINSSVGPQPDGSGFSYHGGAPFITKDCRYDNKYWRSLLCASHYGGGWWLTNHDGYVTKCERVHFNNKLSDTYGCDSRNSYGFATFTYFDGQSCDILERLKSTQMFLFKSV